MLPVAAIGLALKAAEGIPALLRLLKGDKAADVAERVVGAAKVITGVDDAATAVSRIEQDPELMKLWIMEATKVTVAELEAETERLRTVNETIRTESQSEDKFVRRWRPMFGYVVAFSWGWLMLTAGYVVLTDPGKASSVLNGLADLSGMWGIALAVLGVSVVQRSHDKKVAAGASAPGLFGSALSALRPGNKNT